VPLPFPTPAWAAGTVPFTVPTTTLPGLPASRDLCSPSQLTCGSGECLPAERRCDLQLDCQDGSDENGCGRGEAGPGQAGGRPGEGPLPRESLSELGRPVPAVDCGLAPWSGWSSCSRSCGLGLAFQRRELLRPPLPGGSCPPDRLRSQPCFVQACPGNRPPLPGLPVPPPAPRPRWDTLTGKCPCSPLGPVCPAPGL